NLQLSPMAQDRFETDADGRFRLPALPGPGLLTAEGAAEWPLCLNTYLPATITATDRNRPEHFRTSDGVEGFRRSPLSSDHPLFNAYRLIAPPAGAEAFSCDLGLVRGKAVMLKLVGPDGRPVTGAAATGLAANYPDTRVLAGDTATVVALE